MKIKLLPTVRRWNPEHPQHDWVKKIRHHRNCAWCEISVRTNPDDWSLSWTWPADPERTGGTTFQGNPLPVCTGPRPGRARLLHAVLNGSVTSVGVAPGRFEFEAVWRRSVNATGPIERAVHDGLVRLVGNEYPQPELTELGERWLRAYGNLAAAKRAA